MIRRFISQISLFAIILFLFSVPKPSCAQGGKDIPREWIEPDTGHRVIRLSDEPGSASLYFHQNPYTPDGQKLIITTPNGLSAINLKTRAIEKIDEGRCDSSPSVRPLVKLRRFCAERTGTTTSSSRLPIRLCSCFVTKVPGTR